MARTNKYTEKRRKGIVTPYGQWLYPGQVTTIPGNNITMQGVPYPVFGVSDKGDTKMMLPGMDYQFKGNEVTEYPVMQKGGFGRKRVEKNGMEYLKDTDGYTGVVQKQTQHGLGVSRRYDAPVYQYYDNGNPVGESWRGAGDFQNDIVKDYESEPVAPLSRKYSNYDPNSLTSFKDLSTGVTPFKQYLHPATSELINMPVPSFPVPAVTNKKQTPSYTQPVYSAPYANDVPSVGTRNWYEADTDKTVDDYINELQPFMEMIEGRRTNAYQVDGEKQYTIGIGHGNVNIKPTDVWNDEKINSTYLSDMRSRADAIDKYFKDRNVNLNPRVLAGLAAYSFSRPYARVMEASPKLTQAIISGDFDAIRKEMDWGERMGNNRRIVKKHDDLYNWMTLGDFRYGEKYQDGGIHINPKNKGKFTEAAKRAGKSVQAYAAQILANKDNYSPAMVKRANFARNAAKFKHQEGGTYLDTFFSNADKQNNMYDRNAMTQLDNYFTKRGLTENQKKALLYNILIESGGAKTLGAHGNGYYGLVGWDSNRYGKIKDKSLIGQAAYLVDSLKNDNGEYSWNHGGDGSGYNSWIDARNAFWNPDADFDTVNNALIYGYIRPADKIGRKNNAAKFYQTGGIGKYAEGGTPPHWDPDHPHFHMDEEGNIFPADYAGEDNAWTIGENIPNVTPQQIADAIAAHQAAMNDDRYKYIYNPEYQKLLPTLQAAKRIYDWGNKKMDRYPYLSNWEFNHPNMPLRFDENGVGYLNGQTYLPINKPLKDGEKTYSIVGPSDISNSQYYEYVPTDVPPEKIVRTEFPEIPVISNETQIAAKQKAIDKYIANNTRQKRIVSGYNEASSVPYYELDETIYPTIVYYENNAKGENSFVSKLIRSTIDKRKKEWGTNLYYPKGFLSDKKDISYPYEDKRYSVQPIHSHKKFYGVMKNGEYQFPYLEDPSRYIYENTVRDYVDFLNYNTKDSYQKYESIIPSRSQKLLQNELNEWFGTYDDKLAEIPWRIERKAEYHPANTSRTPIYKTITVKPSQEEAERNAQIDLKDLIKKRQTSSIGKYLEGNYVQPQSVNSVLQSWNDMLAKGLSKGDNIANLVGTGLQAAATASSAAATQFGKGFTKDIMAGQGNKQTSVAAPKSEVNFNLDEDLLKTSQEMESADYIEEPVSPNVEFGKFAIGGKLAPNAEIEYGEIAETVGGAEQANGNTNYHISMTDKNETTRNQVTFTNNVHEDVKNNPQLTKLPVRENKYTNARRKGIPYVQVGGMIKQVPFYNEYALMNGTDGKKKTFLYPSTITIGGRITEPVDRTHYPLAEYINQKFLS